MLVSCTLCGGENRIHPGQQMLVCAYCGSTLAVRERSEPEHLILPHRRNDALAALALRSHLSAAGRAAPRDVRVEFSYVPYAFSADDDRAGAGSPCAGEPPGAGRVTSPPAGDYRFFDRALAGGETVAEPARIDPADAQAVRILYLPLYQVAYRAAGEEYRASVMGESLHVYADALPRRRPPAAGASWAEGCLGAPSAFSTPPTLPSSTASASAL